MKYLKRAPKPNAAQLAEIERLEAEAKAALRRREESFERCDTDGFLSQWASGMTAQLNREKIQLLRNGGYARFPVLCDADGNVIADRVHVFANTFAGYGSVEKWRLPADLADKVGRTWIPRAGYSGKSRIQKQLGLHEEDRFFPAYAEIYSAGKGLGGCASATVRIYRKQMAEEAA